MRIFASVFALAVLAATAVPSAGRDLFVDNSAGNDRFTGQQPQVSADQSGPLRSIAQALRLAGGGDRIVLAKTNQPYRESISLVGNRHSGDPQQPFMIDGRGATLDGSAPVPPPLWQHYRGDVYRFRLVRTAQQQLFLDDRPAVRVPVVAWTESPPPLAPRQWCLLGGEIYFCVEPQKLPADYRFSCAQLETGITLYGVDHVGIVELTVQGFRLDGISAFNSARNVYLVGLTCRGNGRCGVSVGGASIVEIEGCLLGNNGQAQLLTLPWSETHVRNSNLLANTAPGWVDQGGRVYLDQKQVQGGLDQLQPAAADAQKSPASGKNNQEKAR